MKTPGPAPEVAATLGARDAVEPAPDAAREEEVRAFTVIWDTVGIQDRPVDLGGASTMRPAGNDGTVAEPEDGLPRLLDGDVRAATPELQLKERLGEGGMGLVCLAEQVPLGRDVAVKQLRPQARSELMRSALLREGRTTGQLEHPNIIPVYALGRDAEDAPIIVMKRVEGVAWSALLRDPDLARRHFETEDPLDGHLEVLGHVCNAIHYAHAKASSIGISSPTM